MADMALSDTIEGETQDAFRKRVQAFYAYEFKPGERWTLFNDKLIVAHPERQPFWVHEGGRIEVVQPMFKMTDTKPYNKTLEPMLQELHLLLHDLEQDKVRVRTLIKKLQCSELTIESSGKACRWPICECGGGVG